MAKTIKAEHVGEQQRRLAKIAHKAGDQSDTLRNEGRKVQRQIKTANETGRLQAGTSGGSAESVLTVKADSYVISTRVPYARFVFKGTRYQAAQPPTIPPDADAQASAAILRDLTRP
jgi:hypothetical protein